MIGMQGSFDMQSSHTWFCETNPHSSIRQHDIWSYRTNSRVFVVLKHHSIAVYDCSYFTAGMLLLEVSVVVYLLQGHTAGSKEVSWKPSQQ